MVCPPVPQKNTLPRAVWRGTVDYIYPYLETETRTNKVRFVVPNPNQKLKPGMYTNLELKVNLGERLAVPEGALLHSGVRKLVFIDRGEGVLEPREVTPWGTNRRVLGGRGWP